jgi:hypothetical protein
VITLGFLSTGFRSAEFLGPQSVGDVIQDTVDHSRFTPLIEGVSDFNILAQDNARVNVAMGEQFKSPGPQDGAQKQLNSIQRHSCVKGRRKNTVDVGSPGADAANDGREQWWIGGDIGDAVDLVTKPMLKEFGQRGLRFCAEKLDLVQHLNRSQPCRAAPRFG